MSEFNPKSVMAISKRMLRAGTDVLVRADHLDPYPSQTPEDVVTEIFSAMFCAAEEEGRLSSEDLAGTLKARARSS